MGAAEKLLEFQFPASSENLCTLREKLRETLGPCSMSDELLNCVILAVGEACMNIIEHAYCDDDCGDIIVEIEKHDDSMVFRLTDFAHRKTREEEMKGRPLDEIRPGGLGCHIINEIMDEVSLIDCDNPCGNVLQMTKKLED